MSEPLTESLSRAADAALACTLFALDPLALGGVALRARVGPARDRWLALLESNLAPGVAMRRIPVAIGEDRLHGALDLAATLRAGRPIVERGLLATVDGGIVVLPGAERLALPTLAALITCLDRGELPIEREGVSLRAAARIGVLALDEGVEPDERPPAALLERLACHVTLEGVRVDDLPMPEPAAGQMADARRLLARVQMPDALLQVLCSLAVALGVGSLRAPVLAARVARAATALEGREVVTDDDITVATRLVLAPRATRMPQSAAQPEAASADAAESEQADAEGEDGASSEPEPLTDRVLAAAAASLPQGLLRGAGARSQSATGRVSSGRGDRLQYGSRGRSLGARPGAPKAGARLSVIDTLRAAAPWQPLREARRSADRPRRTAVEVQRHDFRVVRRRERTRATTIFVVDASGSTALQRLAEAKGAVELLLAESYIRRDQVALIAFRGARAELLLPATRSLVRARRQIAGLPGGGGTPLASGIDLAVELGVLLRRRGGNPFIVLLTDGHANVARDGRPGRAAAAADARAAARGVAARALDALLIDTSRQPEKLAQQLAADMHAAYLALPHADSRVLASAVRARSGTASAMTPRSA